MADSYALPAAGWKGLGNPAGGKGYKYKGAGSPTDPCKVVVVKGAVVKAVCKGTGVTVAPPFVGDVGIVLTVGIGLEALLRELRWRRGQERRDAPQAQGRAGRAVPGAHIDDHVDGDGVDEHDVDDNTDGRVPRD